MPSRQESNDRERARQTLKRLQQNDRLLGTAVIVTSLSELEQQIAAKRPWVALSSSFAPFELSAELGREREESDTNLLVVGSTRVEADSWPLRLYDESFAILHGAGGLLAADQSGFHLYGHSGAWSMSSGERVADGSGVIIDDYGSGRLTVKRASWLTVRSTKEPVLVSIEGPTVVGISAPSEIVSAVDEAHIVLLDDNGPAKLSNIGGAAVARLSYSEWQQRGAKSIDDLADLDWQRSGDHSPTI